MKNSSSGTSLMDESCGNYRRTARHRATALRCVAALAALSHAACGKARSGGLDVSEKAADKVRGTEFGSDEQIKALQGLEQVENKSSWSTLSPTENTCEL
jgi:hypothetical protein